MGCVQAEEEEEEVVDLFCFFLPRRIRFLSDAMMGAMGELEISRQLGQTANRAEYCEGSREGEEGGAGSVGSVKKRSCADEIKHG